MLKKLYLFLALSLTITTPAALAMQITDIASLAAQLNTINTQMNSIKRAWNSARIQIRMAEKTSSTLYASIKPVLDNIIASNDFTSKMNTVVDIQFDSIINNNTPFNTIKADNNLSDFFPNLTMSDYGRKLYTAMANKAYYLLLGQKLANKAKEIAAQITSLQQQTTAPATA